MAQKIGDIEQEAEEHKWVYLAIFLRIHRRTIDSLELSNNIDIWRLHLGLSSRHSNPSLKRESVSAWWMVFWLSGQSKTSYPRWRPTPMAWSKCWKSCWSNTSLSRRNWTTGRLVYFRSLCKIGQRGQTENEGWGLTYLAIQKKNNIQVVQPWTQFDLY